MGEGAGGRDLRSAPWSLVRVGMLEQRRALYPPAGRDTVQLSQAGTKTAWSTPDWFEGTYGSERGLRPRKTIRHRSLPS
jgi:hypothetical protein